MKLKKGKKVVSVKKYQDEDENKDDDGGHDGGEGSYGSYRENKDKSEDVDGDNDWDLDNEGGEDYDGEGSYGSYRENRDMSGDVDGDDDWDLDNEGGENHEGEGSYVVHRKNNMENKDRCASRPCNLCRKEIEKPTRRDKLTAGVTQQLSQIYDVPGNAVEKVDDTLHLCGVCRNTLHRVVRGKQPADTLPNLAVALKPSWTPTNKKQRRRRQDLLNLKSLSGRNRNCKKERPELTHIIEQIKEFCGDNNYDDVELGFYILHKFLSSASKFSTARQLKQLHTNKVQNISPRKSVANKYFAGRSHRSHRSLALFLKQQLGRNVFPSRKAEDQFVDGLQPRSYSYNLYSLSDDPECQTPFKQVQGLQRPPEPDTEGMSKEEIEAVKADHRTHVRDYKKELTAKTFEEQYLNNHCESPIPNTLVVMEDYDRLLAAHIIQLGPQILTRIREINDSRCGLRIPGGRVKAKLLVIDGADGFGDLHIISSKESRDYSQHGITADFTLIRVSIEHQLEAVCLQEGGGGEVGRWGGGGEVHEGGARGEGGGEEHEDHEEILSQALSQSTIGDDSCITASQHSSVATSIDGNTEEEVASFVAVADGYSIVFEEQKPNSSLVSRPIFRGEL